MKYEDMPIRVQKYLIEAYITEVGAKSALESYMTEGKSIIEMNGLTVPNDLSTTEFDVLQELYAEYKVYCAIANDTLAEFRQKDFYKMIENLKARVEAMKANGTYTGSGSSTEQSLYGKGVLIFNE